MPCVQCTSYLINPNSLSIVTEQYNSNKIQQLPLFSQELGLIAKCVLNWSLSKDVHSLGWVLTLQKYMCFTKHFEPIVDLKSNVRAFRYYVGLLQSWSQLFGTLTHPPRTLLSMKRGRVTMR